MDVTSPASLDHHVVVVGAGPAGLVAAICLARQGIDVLVLDKRRAVSDLPRAVGVSVRQMEVFRTWGLEDELRAGAEDVDLALLQASTARTAGQGARLPINVPDRSQSTVVSPTSSARVPQDHLERVLVDHLGRLASCEVRRSSEVTRITQDTTGVRLSVHSGDVPAERTISAAYVVAADGAHSRTRDQLGIDFVGPDRTMVGVSAEFRAPLWPVLGPHRYALYGITDPQGAGVLIPAGTGNRWQLGVVLGPDDDPEEHARTEVLSARIRRASGVRHLPVTIVRTNTFVAGANLAARFQDGRVFLAGDAAHRVTPRAGNGLAMAVRDGLALGWRLAWVLRGWAPPAFLRTYEQELRPLAEQDVTRAADPHGRCHAVLTELLHDLGGRVQHAWVGPGGPGQGPVSTLDLVTEGLTLFVREDPAEWRAAAAALGRNVPVAVVELSAPTGHGLGLRHPGAALLVRPDAVPVARWHRQADHRRAVADLDQAVDDTTTVDHLEVRR